jgi:broad specificity phosphatase PhoE
MPRRIWLARHGNRQDFADPTWHETADRPHDPGLAPDGETQARRLGRRVSDLAIDRVFASPFLRAVQTASFVAAETGHRVRLEPGLGEWLNADWFDTLPMPLPEERLADRFAPVALDHDPCLQPTFPESKPEAFARLGRAAQCLARRHTGDSLLLVGHGVTVQGVLMGLVGDDVSDEGCPLASLTEIVRRNGDWRIVRRNDTRHLDGDDAAANRLA